MRKIAKIKLSGVNHIYEPRKPTETHAIKDINWVVEDGSTIALVGPSGCGKTTLLKIISGLLTPTEGKVHFDGKDVTELSPQERNIAQVFQFPVVYSVKNIYDNLAFPLENKGVPKDEIERKVKNTAKMLGLENMLDKPTDDLNPSDKQMVSLGRGIIRDDAQAILLDEPMTDVDPRERTNIRKRIKKVQSETEMTMVYVTHDQEEALSFAEKVSVMKDGEILQTGSAEELYSRPKYDFVGYFIGSPGMNFLSCSLSDGELDFGPFTLPVFEEDELTLREHDTEFRLGIRPMHLQVSMDEKEEAVKFETTEVANRGDHQILSLEKEGVELKSYAPLSMQLAEGDQVWVVFPEDRRRVYGKKLGELVL